MLPDCVTFMWLLCSVSHQDLAQGSCWCVQLSRGSRGSLQGSCAKGKEGISEGRANIFQLLTHFLLTKRLPGLSCTPHIPDPTCTSFSESLQEKRRCPDAEKHAQMYDWIASWTNLTLVLWNKEEVKMQTDTHFFYPKAQSDSMLNMSTWTKSRRSLSHYFKSLP